MNNEIFSNILSEVDKTAQNVVKLLKEQGLHISTAESCTGGLLSAAITAVSGSSEVFGLGQCTYSNEMKIERLGVSADTLRQYGAVSEQTAREMAEGARRAAKCAVGAATTGIAGPTGGTPEKPVGTVYIAVSKGENTEAKLLQIADDRIEAEKQREYIRLVTINETLELIEEIL